MFFRGTVFMRFLTSLILLALIISGCAGLPRNRFTDPQSRVFIDPQSIDANNYARIQNALVNNGKFVVVDRAQAFNAVKREQNTTQREQNSRFDDKEKWAWIGKLYGVGAIVVANNQCRRETSFWNHDRSNLVCLQRLALINANTGQVMVSVENTNSADYTFDLQYIVPDWVDTVEKMVDNYPKEFETRGYDKGLELYQDISKEHAQRQRELATQK